MGARAWRRRREGPSRANATRAHGIPVVVQAGPGGSPEVGRRPATGDLDRDGTAGDGVRPLLLSEEGAALRCDILRPRAPGRPLPAALHIHGGGFAEGSRASGRPAAWLASLGYAGVAVEDRLRGEAPFPAALQDCRCAVCFLRHHAAALGLDPERIGAWGASPRGAPWGRSSQRPGTWRARGAGRAPLPHRGGLRLVGPGQVLEPARPTPRTGRGRLRQPGRGGRAGAAPVAHHPRARRGGANAPAAMGRDKIVWPSQAVGLRDALAAAGCQPNCAS